jgi:hypothetical protein
MILALTANNSPKILLYFKKEKSLPDWRTSQPVA